MKVNNKKGKSLNIMATISIAIILIGFFIAVINIGFNNISSSNKNIVQGEDINDNYLDMDTQILLSKYKIIVSTDGNELPSDTISYQKAIAIVSEMSKKIYNKELVNRVEIEYFPGVWSILAELTNNSSLNVHLDAKTGKIIYSFLGKEMSNDWSYFDSRFKPNQESSTPNISFDSSLSYSPSSSSVIENLEEEDDYKEMLLEDKKKTIAYIDTMKNSPLGAIALEIVNNLDLGNDVKGVEATVVDSSNKKYIVENTVHSISNNIIEVKLEDNTYIIIHLEANTNDLIGYVYFDNSYLDTYYPEY